MCSGAARLTRALNAVTLVSKLSREHSIVRKQLGVNTMTTTMQRGERHRKIRKRWRVAIWVVRAAHRIVVVCKRGAALRLTPSEMRAVVSAYQATSGLRLCDAEGILSVLRSFGMSLTDEDLRPYLVQVKHRDGVVLGMSQFCKIVHYIKLSYARSRTDDTREAFAALAEEGSSSTVVNMERLRAAVRSFDLNVDLDKLREYTHHTVTHKKGISEEEDENVTLEEFAALVGAGQDTPTVGEGLTRRHSECKRGTLGVMPRPLPGVVSLSPHELNTTTAANIAPLEDSHEQKLDTPTFPSESQSQHHRVSALAAAASSIQSQLRKIGVPSSMACEAADTKKSALCKMLFPTRRSGVEWTVPQVLDRVGQIEATSVAQYGTLSDRIEEGRKDPMRAHKRRIASACAHASRGKSSRNVHYCSPVRQPPVYTAIPTNFVAPRVTPISQSAIDSSVHYCLATRSTAAHSAGSTTQQTNGRPPLSKSGLMPLPCSPYRRQLELDLKPKTLNELCGQPKFVLPQRVRSAVMTRHLNNVRKAADPSTNALPNTLRLFAEATLRVLNSRPQSALT